MNNLYTVCTAAQLKNENHELMSAVQELLEQNQALIRKISKIGDVGNIFLHFHEITTRAYTSIS